MASFGICVVCNKEINYSELVQVIKKDGEYFRFISPQEVRGQELAKAHKPCSKTLQRFNK